MKIIKIGTWNANGMPEDWSIDPGDSGPDSYCLGIDQLGQGIVDVNGVEIVEWTAARREAQS